MPAVMLGAGTSALASETPGPSYQADVARKIPGTSQTLGGVSIRIESLDPAIGIEHSADFVNIPYNQVINIQNSTKIPSSQFIALDVEKPSALPQDWSFKISIYDDLGGDIGSITTGAGGIATFEDQKLRFRIGTDAI
ncbi:hypothetical protein XhyaCFBP1156_16145 [Xanthomonas hyacinthi]|uniref:Uncharacterized protein n=2 Tax=Xanthomonas hyacinthi TaxID=56455 RepID=A0A2S7ESM5_9XANT|nr:hypothetical protein Y886_35850 [Xanthomonas hyacinthi DSM 19077]PPU96127.1 hypothetical protein XhyaCFBP1156_16145 [Xanthomonas hyacinthi]